MHDVKETVLTGCAAATAVALAVAVSASAAGATTRAKRVEFGGSAYGSTAALGSQVRSGKTAYSPMCTTTAGSSRVNRTAAVHLAGTGTIGAVTTKVSSVKKGGTLSTVSTTRTGATSLLGGLVHVRAITTTARVSVTGGVYTHSGSSTLAGLTIAGRSITANPKVGQTITIPAVGKVVLNQQASSGSNGLHSASVTALQVVLKVANLTALPAGNVVVGHANATLHAPTHYNAYGSAYGTRVQVGSTVDSGATAAVYLPCGGSSGATRKNSIAGTSLSGVLGVGAVTSSARSTDTSSATTANTVSHIASVNLLGGAVKVRGIVTAAHAVRHGSQLSLSSSGTRLVGLTVNGTARSVRAGSRGLALPGLGTLYVDRVTKSRNGITVTGLQLVLSTAVGSAVKGTVITVGSATAGVRK